MAQPNVAREPSMEEILASIRRIIESNDPASDAADLHAMPAAYDEEEIEDVEEISFVSDLAANDRGLPRQQEPLVGADTVAASMQSEKSLSLADVAARVRAASARHQEIAASRPSDRADIAPALAEAAPVEHAGLQPVFQEPSAPIIPLSMPALRPSLVEAAKADDADVVARFSTVTDEKPTSMIEPSMPTQSDTVVAEPARLQSVEAASLPVQTESRLDAMTGLLSEAAGAQVAKSFGELADLFDGLERRSVEDMAQEMLRPMLQEWLDDNLPTLVERLVREEIERVARGPRR